MHKVIKNKLQMLTTPTEILHEMEKYYTELFSILPGEIYQSFYEQIKDLQHTSLNCSYKQDILTDTQRQSVITLLLKQDDSGQYKDPVYLQNWRPLTLQNYDTKI